MENTEKKVWFITGVSTGFGKALAEVAMEKGDVVVATFRQPSQAQAFSDSSPGHLGVVVDVVDNDQIKAAIAKTVSVYGRIDVLVNNAGYGSLGSIEEIPEEEVRKQFEVNVYGPVNLMKAVLPHMRAQRAGHIMNITSIGGLVGFPGSGIYNGSKFALEGIGESLAQQVAHLGIKVTNIEPGPFRTDWAGRSATLHQTQIEDYNASVGKHMGVIDNINGNQVGDPMRAAYAMHDLAYLENPPVHLPLGGPAYERARAKIDTLAEEIDQFEYLGLPTDFPAVQPQ